MNAINKTIFTLALCSTALLGACAKDPWLMEGSSLAPLKMQLVEDRHIVKKPLAEFGEQDAVTAAETYNKSGAGPVYVVVAYNDQGKGMDYDAKAASDMLRGTLLRNGVAGEDIVTSMVPLETQTPVALIAFNTLRAAAPENCGEMPGMYELPGQPKHFDYKIGCGVHDLMARQVADPRDLEGRAGVDGASDGERLANIVSNDYRTGEARDFLPSYIVSELAGSTSGN